MSPVLLIAVFIVVCLAAAAMLITSGVGRMLFGRFAVTSDITDDGLTLSDAPSEWIENHEFWEITATEEVAF